MFCIYDIKSQNLRSLLMRWCVTDVNTSVICIPVPSHRIETGSSIHSPHAKMHHIIPGTSLIVYMITALNMMTFSNGITFHPQYWPFVRGIHRSLVNSPHKGQWRGALMFSLTCVWTNDKENNRDAGVLRRHRAHYDVTVANSCWYPVSNVSIPTGRQCILDKEAKH